MLVDGLNIPDQWIDILSDIQTNDLIAMIAGGALRDLSLGRAPKDLDIFTTYIPTDKNLDSTNMNYEGMQYVKAVVTYNVNLDIPFNLIIHEPCTNIAMLESFDFGLCQIGFNGREIIKTPAYDWDFKHGIFTMRRINRYPRSIKRYARWLDRYNWDIAIPELELKGATT